MHDCHYQKLKSPNGGSSRAAKARSQVRGSRSTAQATTDSRGQRASKNLCHQMGITPGETSTAMFGTDIALKHQVAEARFQDFLAEAKREHSVKMPSKGDRRTRRASNSEARAAVASSSSVRAPG